MLAVAEEAKAAGLAARPDLALQLELSRAFVISQAYFKKRQNEGASTPEQVVTKAEIDAYVKEPGHDKQFGDFLEDYRMNRPNKDASISETQRAELQQHWGRVMVGRRKGMAAGIHLERQTQLVVMLQQARLLAGAFREELSPRYKATDAAVALPRGPTGDGPQESRAKIESILKRGSAAGEDFAALAREFSTDPGSREDGRRLGWFGRGVDVKALRGRRLRAQGGEISESSSTPSASTSSSSKNVACREWRERRHGGEQVRARTSSFLTTRGPASPAAARFATRAGARRRRGVEARARARRISADAVSSPRRLLGRDFSRRARKATYAADSGGTPRGVEPKPPARTNRDEPTKENPRGARTIKAERRVTEWASARGGRSGRPTASARRPVSCRSARKRFFCILAGCPAAPGPRRCVRGDL